MEVPHKTIVLLTVAVALLRGPSCLAAECLPGPGIAVLASPDVPVAGYPVQVLVATEMPFGHIAGRVFFAGAQADAMATARGGGPPYWAVLQFVPPESGAHQLTVTLDGRHHCQVIAVNQDSSPRPAARSVWLAHRQWDRGFENLYSAWLEHLFSDPEGTSWPALHELTRSPQHNLLHNHLDLGEDAAAGTRTLRMEPDCADNPYFLRAYFAWKLGLPFGFYQCDRGRQGRDPRCAGWTTQGAPRGARHPVRAFHLFLRRLKSAVHSSSARTALDSNTSDLYPLPLTPTALRPGTVFADPYGHTLMLVRRQPQTAGGPGLLMAVDAQPDGTVTIKRFWRGNFLFATESVIGGPGFKAFRPVFSAGATFVPLSNDELAETTEFTPFALAQKGLDTTAFYDAMSRVVNPLPMAPELAYRQLHDALFEQVMTRVKAVENGEAWAARNAGRTVAMPEGIAIFQTSGPWEDFSTPARDLRLLIALDAVVDFPERLMRIPDSFILPPGTSATQMADRLRGLSAQWTDEVRFKYMRSDGSAVELTLADLFLRVRSLEMGYNPNDCPEIRWGAAPESAEVSTCSRRAPRSQRRQMGRYRDWFRTRRRPAWN